MKKLLSDRLNIHASKVGALFQVEAILIVETYGLLDINIIQESR